MSPYISIALSPHWLADSQMSHTDIQVCTTEHQYTALHSTTTTCIYTQQPLHNEEQQDEVVTLPDHFNLVFVPKDPSHVPSPTRFRSGAGEKCYWTAVAFNTSCIVLMVLCASIFAVGLMVRLKSNTSPFLPPLGNNATGHSNTWWQSDTNKANPSVRMAEIYS